MKKYKVGLITQPPPVDLRGIVKNNDKKIGIKVM
jgi:hypothetical protein